MNTLSRILVLLPLLLVAGCQQQVAPQPTPAATAQPTAVPTAPLATPAGECPGAGGARGPGERAEAVSIWRWFGWGFQSEWRGAASGAAGLWLVDLSGDHRPEVVVRIR